MVGGFRRGSGGWTSQNREPEESCIRLCDLAVVVIQCHFHHILGGSQGCMVRGEEKQILLLNGKRQDSGRAREARNVAMAILGEHSHSALTGCRVFFLHLLAKVKRIRISGHLSFLHLTTTPTHTIIESSGKLDRQGFADEFICPVPRLGGLRGVNEAGSSILWLRTTFWSQMEKTEPHL